MPSRTDRSVVASAAGAALLLTLTGCPAPEDGQGRKDGVSSTAVDLGTDKMGIHWWLALGNKGWEGMLTDTQEYPFSNVMMLSRDGKSKSEPFIPAAGRSVTVGVAACVNGEWKFSPYAATGIGVPGNKPTWNIIDPWTIDLNTAAVDRGVCALTIPKAMANPEFGAMGL